MYYHPAGMKVVRPTMMGNSAKTHTCLPHCHVSAASGVALFHHYWMSEYRISNRVLVLAGGACWTTVLSDAGNRDVTHRLHPRSTRHW